MGYKTVLKNEQECHMGSKLILGIVYMMFAVSLICIINNRNYFFVSKISFEKVTFWRKNEDSAEIVPFFLFLLEMSWECVSVGVWVGNPLPFQCCSKLHLLELGLELGQKMGF